MKQYNLISENEESTVIAQYESQVVHESEYQSEAELEKAFIRQLEDQKYERLHIHNEKDLIANLRKQIERLNDYTFTEDEWKRFFEGNIARRNDGIEEKSFIIQEDYIQVLERDGGELPMNIYLIDKKNILRYILK